jgi:hypothetical protein
VQYEQHYTLNTVKSLNIRLKVGEILEKDVRLLTRGWESDDKMAAECGQEHGTFWNKRMSDYGT